MSRNFRRQGEGKATGIQPRKEMNENLNNCFPKDAVKRKSNLYIMVMVDRGNLNELDVCPERSKCGIKTFSPHTHKRIINYWSNLRVNNYQEWFGCSSPCSEAQGTVWTTS